MSFPPYSTVLNITLGEKSKLFVKHGSFKINNHINAFSIQGSREDFEKTQSFVELSKHALDGIYGTLPEISFKNLKTVILNERSLDKLLEVNLVVENVWQLIAEKETFGTTTFNASFSDIADLRFRESVLLTENYNLTTPKIFINRSWIDNFYPLRGKKVTELRIENSEIKTLKSSAFSILELPSLIMDNVTIHMIESDVLKVNVS